MKQLPPIQRARSTGHGALRQHQDALRRARRQVAAPPRAPALQQPSSGWWDEGRWTASQACSQMRRRRPWPSCMGQMMKTRARMHASRMEARSPAQEVKRSGVWVPAADAAQAAPDHAWLVQLLSCSGCWRSRRLLSPRNRPPCMGPPYVGPQPHASLLSSIASTSVASMMATLSRRSGVRSSWSEGALRRLEHV